MAGIKISALPAVPSAALTDIFPVVQGGVTSQESLTQVLALFQGKITSLGAQTAALNMNTNLINNVTNPVSAQDAATKNYVDTLVTGGGAAVVAATTGALTVTQAGAGIGATLTNAGAQAAFQTDGVSPTLGQRILVKNQVTTSQNGIYTLSTVGSGSTNWVLTRASDYDTPADINSTGVIPVTTGTVNANTGWINTTTMVTVDTTAVTFVQFGVSFPVSLANGGTNANLTAANGAIPYSTASAFALLSPGTAGQLLRSGGGAAPTWTTSTYPTTNAINTLLYASSANVMAALSTANSGVLITSAAGVPSISTTTPAGLTIPQPGIVGVITVSNATAGNVGEYVDSGIVTGSFVSPGTNANMTSISLTAGDWDVYLNADGIPADATTSSFIVGINTTSVTLPPAGGISYAQVAKNTTGGGLAGANYLFVRARINVSATTTVFAVGQMTWAASTPGFSCQMVARRIR